jgi:glycerol-3-phosphate O-acyltransferase
MNKRKKFIAPKSQLFPDIKDWPIYKLHKDRDKFVSEICEQTFQVIRNTYNEDLFSLLAKTSYSELIRVKNYPWKVDPNDDKQFWSRLQKEIKALNSNTPEEQSKKEDILNRIIRRYAEEIVGSFKEKTFRFARVFLSFFFSRLLNSAAGKRFSRFYNSDHHLYERLVAAGEVDHVRELAKKGTIVMVPNHFSNLDSILIGYVIDRALGLPAVSYGAGLNLFNNGAVAYFMNKLGAYRLDRRKKNVIYLEVLKVMSRIAIQKGTNSLFFPGGTRSRSGSMESRLKLGLLGTLIEAQRNKIENGDKEKIFVVPVVLGYHNVLEARFMIHEFLRKTGKEMYFKTKEKFSIRKILHFAWKVFRNGSAITVTFGKPLDVFGNFVDEKGVSKGLHDGEIDISSYYKREGALIYDKQRETKYTQNLAERIIDRYKKENIVLNSHFIARVAFDCFREQNNELDIYGFLRLPVEDYSLEYDAFKAAVMNRLDVFKQMESEGLFNLSEDLKGTDYDAIIKRGIENLSTFHVAQPIFIDKEGAVRSKNFHLLFYYYNRLEGYNL